MNQEREAFKLPVQKEQEDRRFKDFEALVCKALKSQLYNIINSQPLDFDNELARAVKLIWQDGYNESTKLWNLKFGTTAFETTQEKSMASQPTQKELSRKLSTGTGSGKALKK